jgi:hypothetical protein
MLALVDVATYPSEVTPYALIGAIALIAVVVAAVGVFLLFYRRRRNRDRSS